MDESETSVMVSITDSVNNSSVLDLIRNTFCLRHSRVPHMLIQDFVNKECLTPNNSLQFWLPGDEVVPQPRLYEAVVFRNFFVASLQFLLKKFIADVLERFEVQLHQLTPNAITRLRVFTMAMKMMGCELLVDMFVRF